MKNNVKSQHLVRNRITWLLMAALVVGSLVAMAQESPEDKPRPTKGRRMLSVKWGIGWWIWDDRYVDKQTCRFWRSFTIPENAGVMRARLRITADNGYRVMLDGRELGRGSEWKVLTEYDLTWLLPPGEHVLAVEAFNDDQNAGLALGLRVEFTDENVMEFGSDDQWRIVPDGLHGWERLKQAAPDWRKATIVVGDFGRESWSARYSKIKSIVQVAPLYPLETRFWQTVWFQIVVLSACGLAVLVCLWLAAKLTVQSKAQAMLGRERARIARDIHDDLGAGLTRLVVLGELMQKEMPPESRQRTQAEQLCAATREQLRTIDDVIWAVNSRRDTLRDFVTHVAEYAEVYFQNTPIRCRLDLDSEFPEICFPLPVRRNLFLAVKETLHNAAKHSGATEIFLRIHRVGENLQVVVEDNGRGFDPEVAKPERDGLTNRQERMAEIGGKCKVISQSGQGCRIELQVALGAKPSRWLRRTTSPTPEHPPELSPQKSGKPSSEFVSS